MGKLGQKKADQSYRRLPQIETEEMRYAKRIWISLPRELRTTPYMTQLIGKSEITVGRWRQGGRWDEAVLELEKYNNPFYARHKSEIAETLDDLWDILRERIRRKRNMEICVQAQDDNEETKVQGPDVEAITEKMVLEHKRLNNVREHKDILDLIEAVDKIMKAGQIAVTPPAIHAGDIKVRGNAQVLIENG